MFSHLLSRLVSAAATLGLGTGMMFVSGCGSDECCDGGDASSATAPAAYETQTVNTDSDSAGPADNVSSNGTASGPVDSTVKGANNTAGNAVQGAENTAGNAVQGAENTANKAVQGAKSLIP